MEAAAPVLKPFFVLASVCCLECGEIYAKPVAGGTVEMNPGCPECGYVGWIPLNPPEQTRPRRSAVGRRLFPLARSR
jgi:hypothetical protein